MSSSNLFETELRKLTEEIRALQAKVNKTGSIELWLKIGGSLLAFLTVAIGLYQYVSTAHEGFRKTIWAEQYTLYKEACTAAAEVASATALADVNESRLRFWHLYWGKLSILEHRNVKEAMQAYGTQLKNVEQGTASPATLQQLSYSLARACRESLQLTWNPVDIGDLGKGDK